MITDQLPALESEKITGCRLVSSTFPPLAIFDDVANADEFDALFAIQAMTNPRLLNEVGNLELIPRADIPFGIAGCHYATAPFTHINPNGSRFADGRFGVLYVADTMNTALAEVTHHQQAYWSRVEGLNFDRLVFRGLRCEFDQQGLLDATTLAAHHPIYHPDDYSHSRELGASVWRAKLPGLKYHSVRNPGHQCWALMTPRPVTSIIQSAHFEMIWNGRITAINQISAAF